jgi:hypothetical protein
MKPRPKLTELEQAKAITMARDGSTHAEIAACYECREAIRIINRTISCT